MTNHEYIDHELRIRLLEKSINSIDEKMSLAIKLLVTSIIIPLTLKYFGWM